MARECDPVGFPRFQRRGCPQIDAHSWSFSPQATIGPSFTAGQGRPHTPRFCRLQSAEECAREPQALASGRSAEYDSQIQLDASISRHEIVLEMGYALINRLIASCCKRIPLVRRTNPRNRMLV